MASELTLAGKSDIPLLAAVLAASGGVGGSPDPICSVNFKTTLIRSLFNSTQCLSQLMNEDSLLDGSLL